MPNWCSTAYAIEGDAKEVKQLYELMKGLQERKEPSVENGFGTSWLGCLVDALGGDYNTVYCRGDWNGLEMKDGVIRFSTETAWSPCNETFDLVCEKFPSLRYYFQAEEPGMVIYETNDSEGIYFPDRFYVDVCTNEEVYDSTYLSELKDVFEWIEELVGQPIKSQEDVDRLVEQWQIENEDAFCYIHEYEVVDR